MLKHLLLSSLLAWSASAAEIELTLNNTVPLVGPINMFSMAVVSMQLDEVALEPKKEFYLLIHSPGGMVDPVLETAKQAGKLANLHSVVVVAMSGAAAMSQAVGGSRFVVPKGMFLFHKIRQYLDGPITADIARGMARDISEVDKPFSKLCSKRMNISLQDYNERTRSDWAFKAEYALAVQAADSIQTFKCAKDLYDAKIMVPVFDYISGIRGWKNLCDLLGETI